MSDTPAPAKVELRASGKTTKRSPVFDVHVAGRKVGTLRRIFDNERLAERWASRCEWGFFSLVNPAGKRQFNTFTDAVASLTAIPPQAWDDQPAAFAPLIVGA